MKTFFTFLFLLLVVFVQLSLSVPTTQGKGKGKDPQDAPLPILELPYGSFAPSHKHKVTQIWTFQSIPYAAPPVGELRWEKPAPPLNHTTSIQGGNRKGACCFQAPMDGMNIKETKDPYKDHMDNILCMDKGTCECRRQGEDCLFLDIQVPDRALKDPSLRLPVVVFIPGSSFVNGHNDFPHPRLPFYDGDSLIKASRDEIIYVTFNYRAGAFGFLAGKTIEEEAVANVGLWDQRAAFQWVRDHITKLGGNPQQVTAMGHSEGAASIMFHLTAQSGTLDPLFHRAIILSPYHTPMWDRNGRVEERFRRFATLAGCEDQGLNCLREVESGILQEANRALLLEEPNGVFPIGPTPDGDYIRQLPAVELAYGNVWPIESLILSHVASETANFFNPELEKDGGFDEFLHGLLPDYMVNGTFIDRINEHYPPSVGKRKMVYKSQNERMQMFLRDSCVTCHVRWLLEATGHENTWVMRFNFPPPTHGYDLMAMFLYDEHDLSRFENLVLSTLTFFIGAIQDGMTLGYKSYMTSFIRTGNPNVHRRRWREAFPHMRAKTWRNPEILTERDHVNAVLEVHASPIGYFDHVRDKDMPRSQCDFWKSFFVDATLQGNYTLTAELKKLTGVYDE